MTRHGTRWFLPCLAFAAGAAVAAPADPPFEVERILGEAEIVALTSGKTFHYTLLGQPRGDEQHYRDGRVTWRLPDGTCMHGIWVAKEETLCYYYGAFRYGCWNVVENAEGFRHSPLDDDMKPSGGPSVYINRISEEPVGCAPQQLASLSP